MPCYPNYVVSNLGRVKRIATITTDALNRRYCRSEKILNGSLFKRRRLVDLRNSDGHLMEVVARIVLTVFVRPPVQGEMARHLNDNPDDNRLLNLAWGTHADNVADAVKNGKYNKRYGDKCVKLTEDQVRKIRALYKPYDKEFGSGGLAARFGINQSTAYKIALNKTWTHIT